MEGSGRPDFEESIRNGVVPTLAIFTLYFIFDKFMPRWAKLGITMLPVVLQNIMRWRRKHILWQLRLGMFITDFMWAATLIIAVPLRYHLVIHFASWNHLLPCLAETICYWRRDSPAAQANKEWIRRRNCILVLVCWSTIITHVTWCVAAIKWVVVWINMPLICLGAVLWTLETWQRGSTPLLRAICVKLINAIIQTVDTYQIVQAGLLEGYPKALQAKQCRREQEQESRHTLPTYKYTPLEKDETRLLVLKRATWIWPSAIKASLIHMPANSTLEYEAVSYCWGSRERPDEIVIDGARFNVTRSALELLLARRSIWEDRVIWIDAICINQDDEREKTAQVQRMRDVYQLASRVLAFPCSDFRMRLIEPLLTELSTGTVKNPGRSGFRIFCSGSSTMSLQWRILARLLSSAYFRRAWVFQEIAVGGRVDIYLGGQYVSWMTLANAIANVSLDGIEALHTTVARAARSQGTDDLFLTDSQSIGNIYMLADFRTQAMHLLSDGTLDDKGIFSTMHTASGWYYGSVPADDLAIGLFYTNEFDASDARDKLFAILGITNHYPDNKCLQPDYTKSKEKVFEDVTRYLLFDCQHPSIDILSLAGNGEHESRGPLPSWVPHLGEERSSFRFTNAIHYGYRFLACGNREALVAEGNLPGSILVSGSVADRIAYLSNVGPLKIAKQYSLENLSQQVDVGHRVVDFTRGAKSLIDQHHHHWPDLQGQLWRCLIAGGSKDTKPFESQLPGVIPYFMIFVEAEQAAAEKGASIEEYVKVLARYDTSTDMKTMEDWIKGGMSAYISSMAHVCMGRCFGITLSGRLCLVPPLTKVGDIAFVASGAQVPLVLRQKNDFKN